MHNGFVYNNKSSITMRANFYENWYTYDFMLCEINHR